MRMATALARTGSGQTSERSEYRKPTQESDPEDFENPMMYRTRGGDVEGRGREGKTRQGKGRKGKEKKGNAVTK
jgi:hypothetical protein